MKLVRYECDVCKAEHGYKEHRTVKAQLSGHPPMSKDVCSDACGRRALIAYTNELQKRENP